MQEPIEPGQVFYLDPARIQQDAVIQGVLPGTARPYLVVGVFLDRIWLHPLTTHPPARVETIPLGPTDWAEGRTEKLSTSVLSISTALRMLEGNLRYAAEQQEFFQGPRPRLTQEALDAIRSKLQEQRQDDARREGEV